MNNTYIANICYLVVTYFIKKMISNELDCKCSQVSETTKHYMTFALNEKFTANSDKLKYVVIITNKKF